MYRNNKGLIRNVCIYAFMVNSNLKKNNHIKKQNNRNTKIK